MLKIHYTSDANIRALVKLDPSKIK